MKSLESIFLITTDTDEFVYEIEEDGLVSKLIGSYDGETEEAEFTLVEGDGDDDNSLFKIVDDELRAEVLILVLLMTGPSISFESE